VDEDGGGGVGVECGRIDTDVLGRNESLPRSRHESTAVKTARLGNIEYSRQQSSSHLIHVLSVYAVYVKVTVG